MFSAILIAGLLQGGVYALTSVGLTLMFGVLRIVNFAHGDFLVMAMYLTYAVMIGLGWDPLLAIVIVVPFFLFAGALLYYVVIRRTFSAPAPPLAQVFATVGLSILLQNGALLVMGGDEYQSPSHLLTGVIVIGQLRLEASKALMLAVALLLGAASRLWLHATGSGKRVRAVAENPTAALLMGINVHRVYAATFALSCGIVGLAGALMSIDTLAEPNLGPHLALLCFMTVVIGGLGSIGGAIAGGLLIGVVEATTSFMLGPIVSQAFVYVMFLLVLLLRPAGLFGVQGYFEARAE